MNSAATKVVRSQSFGLLASGSGTRAFAFIQAHLCLRRLSHRHRRCYAGAGGACSRAMSDKISANICRGTATSAIWNVTSRPWLTTLAPILITSPAGWSTTTAPPSSASPDGDLSTMIRWPQFNRPSRIYGVFLVSHKAISRLLDDPSMRRYYRTRVIPEESLFHTAFCSQVDLRICKDHKQYEDWTSGGAGPRWLDVSDVPKFLVSGVHFAMKFWDTELLELVETRIVTGRPATAGARRPCGDPPLRSQPLSDRLNSPRGNDT